MLRLQFFFFRYQWYRGSQLISDVTTPEWKVDPVTLETETNFTCRAVNEAGGGVQAMVYVEVMGKIDLFKLKRLFSHTFKKLYVQIYK